MAIIQNKYDLAKYMISEYSRMYGGMISPIKLQKGLYFLYAYWGGKIRSAKLSINDDEIEEMTEMDFSHYDEELFDADFEAWAYGPVDRSIYVWFKETSIEEKESYHNYELKVEKDILAYIDDLLLRIFNSNDFGLVDLSHEDRCWRDVYNPTRKNKMKNEEIIAEYAK